MKRATWNGQTIAESNDVVTVEGNVYFPESALRREFVRPSETHTSCAWKGVASYFSLEVGGQKNPDAVWYYPSPSEAAKHITGRVAFWRGVVISDV